MGCHGAQGRSTHTNCSDHVCMSVDFVSWCVCVSRAECSKKVRKCLSCREVVEDKQILVRALPSRIASQSSPLSDTLLLYLFTFTNPSHHTIPLDFSPSVLTLTHSSLLHSHLTLTATTHPCVTPNDSTLTHHSLFHSLLTLTFTPHSHTHSSLLTTEPTSSPYMPHFIHKD